MPDPIRFVLSSVSRLELGDEAVKRIFDHLRNVLLIGALLAVVAWQLRGITTQHVVAQVLGWSTALLLVVLGAFLSAVNYVQGHRQLTAATAPRWALVGLRLTYGLLFTTVVLSVSKLFG